jgi:hypothetical protein
VEQAGVVSEARPELVNERFFGQHDLQNGEGGMDDVSVALIDDDGGLQSNGRTATVR